MIEFEGSIFIECPVCKQIKMPKNNKYCSLACFQLSKQIEKSKANDTK